MPKLPGPKEAYDELDRWFCLFREGGEADIENLPDLLQSDGMKEAVEVSHQISESQRESFIYQQRLEALSLEATKKNEMGETRRKMEEAEQELEETTHELEEAKQREAQERQEKERLLALLR